MKVYLGFECSTNDIDCWRNVVKVFGNELDALAWAEEVAATEWEWREYDEYKVE